MDLIIMNATDQRYNFIYRLPESKTLSEIMIDAGTQLHIIRGITKDVYDYIVNQHAKYGMKSVEEASRIRAQDGVKLGLIHSDKPIPAKFYELAEENNDVVTADRMQLEKEKVAYAIGKKIETDPELNEFAQEVEVEIVEERSKKDANSSTPKVSQKFKTKIQ